MGRRSHEDRIEGIRHHAGSLYGFAGWLEAEVQSMCALVPNWQDHLSSEGVYLEGSSTDPATAAAIHAIIALKNTQQSIDHYLDDLKGGHVEHERSE